MTARPRSGLISKMNAVVTFVVLSALLVAGKVLRMQIPLLQRMYLPSSVVGGMLGLALVHGLGPAVPAEIVRVPSRPTFLWTARRWSASRARRSTISW